MLNGRCTGDLTGNFTCHNYRGSSVVDYCSIYESLLINFDLLAFI